MRAIVDRVRRAMTPAQRAAWADIEAGLRAHGLYASMSWRDIRDRYRRSVLGPFWLTLSQAITILSMAVIFSQIFRIEIANYLPYLTLGMLLWGLLCSLVVEGCQVFVAAAPYIKNVRVPYTVFVMQLVMRNLWIFVHQIVIFVPMVFLFHVPVSWVGLLSIPGLLLCVFTGFWVAFLVGMTAARFRDLPPIITSILGVALYLTPVMWRTEMLGERARWLMFNPFTHFLEIVRAPLLGQAPNPWSWAVSAGVSLAIMLVALRLFVRYRSRIVFWV